MQPDLAMVPDFETEYIGDINGKAIFSGEIDLKKICPQSLKEILETKDWWTWKYKIQYLMNGTESNGKIVEKNATLQVNLLQSAIFGQLTEQAKILIDMAGNKDRLHETLTETLKLKDDPDLSLFSTCEWMRGANAVHLAARFDPKILAYIVKLEIGLKDVKSLHTSCTPLHVSVGVQNAKSTKVIFHI